MTLMITVFNFQRVRTLIKEALMLFAADRNNLPDYALESTGGSVLSTRCSETYHRQTAQLSLFGIPLYYSSNSPRTVIQVGVHVYAVEMYWFSNCYVHLTLLISTN